MPPMTPKPLASTTMLLTPPPVKARLEILEKQCEGLIGEKGTMERKHKAELSSLMNQLTSTRSILAETQSNLQAVQKKVSSSVETERKEIQAWEKEKHEMQLQATLMRQRAALVIAEEQVRIIDLERECAEGVKGRLIQEHRMALFKSREEDLKMQLEDKKAMVKSLKLENTMITTTLSTLRQRHRSTFSNLQQTTAEVSSLTTRHSILSTSYENAMEELSSTRETIGTMEGELNDARRDVEDGKRTKNKLEKVIVGLRERCDEKQKELDGWLREEKGNNGEVDKEIRSLKHEIKNLRSDLSTRSEEVSELELEAEQLRTTLREKEKEIRRGARQQGDAGRGGEFEEEVKEVKAKLLMKEKEMRKAERAGEGKDKKIRELEAQLFTLRGKSSAAAEPAVPVDSDDQDDVPVAKTQQKRKKPVEEDDDEESTEVKKVAKKITSTAAVRQRTKPTSYAEAPNSAGSEDEAPRPAPRKKVTEKDTAVHAKRPFAESTVQEALQPVEEVAPPPKPKSKESLKKINSIFTKPVEKVGKPVEIMATAAEEEQPVEKKKKRKLGGLGEKTAFVWDQIQNPEGPIPSYLSPVKKSTGAIPRAGWGPTSKSLFPRI